MFSSSARRIFSVRAGKKSEAKKVFGSVRRIERLLKFRIIRARRIMWTTDFTVLATIVLRTLLVYLAVMVGLRLAGKREIGQMNALDFVLLLLIANTVQNAMTGPDTSVNGGLTAAATLLAANYLVTLIASKSARAESLVEGEATLLVYQGKVNTKNMIRERITSDELNEALREHEIEGVREVALAVLEIDGSISVLKTAEMPNPKHSRHRIRFLKHQ